MLILVAGDNYLILFVGWEGIGVSSYLLINFWFTRIQANKSAIKAMVVNRVGDTFLSVAFFGVFWAFGNLDYATVYSLSPYMNETVLTVIGLLFLFAAMGKSAQLGLHMWLPDAMEGWWYNFLIIIMGALFLTTYNYAVGDYDIHCLSMIPLALSKLPRRTLEIMSANILADGCLRYSNFKRDGVAKGNARYEMTMSAKALGYIQYLLDTVYAPFINSGLSPWPNTALPQHAGKVITQYYFTSLAHPIFTSLHALWYVWDSELNKYTKIVPLYLAEVFTGVFIAHWLMEDGYWEQDGKTIFFCTECFSRQDNLFLIQLLSHLGIKATLKIRNKAKDACRIRVSRKSLTVLRELVQEHMHPVFMYKLGPV